ncbi:MAG: ABC transporter permease [Planctomycetota bacterium JB042]
MTATDTTTDTKKAPAAAGPAGAVDVGALSGIRVIAGREIAQYFDSKIAYVYTIAFVVLANSIFMNEFFLTGLVDMTGFFSTMSLLLPLFLPAVTMRLWAEERKTRTIELLLTMPIRPITAVLGKYVAALALFLLFLVGTAPIVLMLTVLGEPDLGKIAAGYLGLFLTGALFLSIGTLISSLSSDQIVTFVSTVVVCFLFVLSGQENVVAVLDGLAPTLELGTTLHDSFSVAPHYDAFVRGVVGLPALVYFVGLSALFLYLNALVLERNRS